MSNSFTPGVYVAPGPVQVGLEILGAEMRPLLVALNELYARPMRAFSQGWSEIDRPFRVNSLLVGGTPSAMWPCVAWRGASPADLVIHVRAKAPASANGRLRFVCGAVFADIALTAGDPTKWYTCTLTACAVSVWGTSGLRTCDVELYVDGADALPAFPDPTVVFEVYGEWVGLTSPLPAGDLDSGYVGLDPDELLADEPVAADLVQTVRSNIVALSARYRSLWSWSGLLGVDEPTEGPEEMAAWPHRALFPHLQGSEEDGAYGALGLRLALVVEATGFPRRVQGSYATAQIGDVGGRGAVFRSATVLMGSRYLIWLPRDVLSRDQPFQVQIYPAGSDSPSGDGAQWRATAGITRACLWGV